MIQLRRIREYAPKGHGVKSVESPTVPPVEVECIADLFQKLPKALEAIPKEERWNLFYTLGDTDGDYRRNWVGQDVIPFDIDGVVDEAGNFDEEAYLSTIFEVLSVDPTKCVVVASGNGIQILVAPPHRIENKDFFRIQRKAYERICRQIEDALKAKGLRVKEVDPSSFALNRIFRLPGTENRKPNKTSRICRLINSKLEPQPFAIAPTTSTAKKKTKAKAKDPLDVSEKEQVTDKQLKFFTIDTPAVENGCDFLKWAKANPADVNEPTWYALLSVLGRLEGGRKLVHQYSQGHPRYNEMDADRKLDQALAASGPRTCENIDQLWGKCSSCPNFKRVNSPVSIKSENFVATENSGFYLLGKNGGLQPQYEDLRRNFHREHAYKTQEKSALVYVWDGKRYTTWSETQLRNYAHEKFNPKPAEHVASEFCQWVNRTNLISGEWFKESTQGLINFANGVLNLATGTLSPHTPEQGFLYALPYGYDPTATCPAFDKFMGEITSGDKQIQALLHEFLGYSICDQDYWLQKAILLIGEGSNGKSTYLKIAEELAGRENIAFLSLYDLQVETSRSHLEGKLLNISDELPNYNFKNTELLKKLLGGTMTARKLYHDGTMIENSTKFIFAGNEIPSTNDVSEGLFRRLVIVPFSAKFSQGPGDVDAKAADITLLARIKAELPGVFNRVMEHYRNLKARGHLITSDKAVIEHKRYRAEVDRTGSWVKDNLLWNGAWGEDKPFIEINVAYERYVSESKRNEEKPLPKFHWIKHLRRNIAHFDDRHKRRRQGGGERVYVLHGVEFRKDTAKDHF